MEQANGLDWELLLAGVGTLVWIVLLTHQIASTLPRRKARLKTDLEILNLMDATHEEYERLRASVDRAITDVYLAHPLSTFQRSWRIGLCGLISIVLLGWAIYMVHDGWSWWALPVGYIGVNFGIATSQWI